MNILKKLTIKNLKLNKKRAIGTIMGIILSTALICAVAGMFASFQATLVENTIQEYGYYHLALDGIDQEKYEKLKHNKDIKDIYKLYIVGHAQIPLLNEEDVGLLQIYSSDRKTFDDLKFSLEEGKYPTNENEIVLSRRVMNNSNYKIGDIITLDVGTRKTTDGYDLRDSNPYHKDLEILENPVKKEYKVVGFISRHNWGQSNYGVTASSESAKMKAYVSLKNPREYKSSIPEILGVQTLSNVYENPEINGYYCTVNNELLRWEVFKFSDDTITMFYAVGAVVISIIVISSVFCIRNSFAISTLEKMRMYGMLASVGVTKKQIRRSVIYEGLVLAIIGIPLGVLSGIFADFVIIKVINAILSGVLFQYVDGFVFKISILAIILSTVLGLVTIYFSSIFSAIKAGKVSPIENLRNSKEIKINSKKLRTPKIIDAIFKTGGELAYKNLKRSKKKYRTTVISLTVSIFVFISMSAFINDTFRESGQYYTDYDYNVRITNVSNLSNDKVEEIKNLSSYEKMYLTYTTKEYIDLEDRSYIIDYPDDGSEEEDLKYINIGILGLDDASFKAYAEKLKVPYDDVKKKGILCDNYIYITNEGREKRTSRFSYKKGDVVRGTIFEDKSIAIPIGAITKQQPYGYERYYYNGGYLVVNKDYYDDLGLYLDKILVDVKKADNFLKDVTAIDKDLDVDDLNESVREEKSILLVVSIFLYGFITVITLIGVTNIFNTITSNMELRSKEFAMLKSIGMTKKEFNRMMNLETLFYSFKSLFFGICLGLVGAYFIHKSFGIRSEAEFMFPHTAIIISIVFVFIIVGLIMKYSISKINKLNTIETIRNENI